MPRKMCIHSNPFVLINQLPAKAAMGLCVNRFCNIFYTSFNENYMSSEGAGPESAEFLYRGRRLQTEADSRIAVKSTTTRKRQKQAGCHG
jgi:hypothetical protein